MKRAATPASDYEVVRKMLDRVRQFESTGRMTPVEARLFQQTRDRWTAAREAFVLTPAERESLTTTVRTVEARLKTHPYPKFF
jgi:hypothetical protein